jgi:hypothetical protein
MLRHVLIRRGAVALLIVLASACTSGSIASSVSPAGPATLAILHPAEGDQIYGTEVSVLVRLTGTSPGIFAYSLGGRVLARSSLPWHEIKGVRYGEHVLRVELVGPDGRPFDPPLTATVTFETSKDE